MQTKQKEKEINNFLPPHQKRCAIVVPFDGTATATSKQHKWPQKDHALLPRMVLAGWQPKTKHVNQYMLLIKITTFRHFRAASWT